MKRIFICAERFFPRGDAGANRVLYIAKALQAKGWKVIVFSIGKNDEKDFNKNGYYYEGIRYENITCKTIGTVQKVERFFLNGKKTVVLLKKHGLTSDDRVYIYSSTAGYTRAVLNYAQKLDATVVTDVVEWHQPFQFKYGRFDLRYRSFMQCFNKLFVEAKNVITISEMLKKHFEGQGCNVLELPIYIEPKDSFEYKPEEGKLNLIYPGNPYRKDSLEMMLDSLSMLDIDERQKICLHLTGVSRQMLEQSVPGKEKLLNMECVKIHGWMKYQELMDLYRSIDFAFIARPDNTVTNANFPSKVPELMNRGIPVIINTIGDIKEYLHDSEDAVLIMEATSIACFRALKICLQKSKTDVMKMHENAFQNAKTQFDYRLSEERLDSYFSTI